jgi:hypothetical protein
MGFLLTGFLWDIWHQHPMSVPPELATYKRKRTPKARYPKRRVLMPSRRRPEA